MNKELKKIISSTKDELLKRLEVMALVTEKLKELNVIPIIVGGQAVEFYTAGGYSTMDIDVICPASIAEIDEILEEIGFTRDGKYWILEKTDIAIEVPSGPLAGSRDKLTEVEVPGGRRVYFIGIEDIIIDRLNRFKHWQVTTDREWILGMMVFNYNEIDWDYLLEKAAQEKVLSEAKELKIIAQKKKIKNNL
ncbi:MAG: DUF6036 family nucleotidyltransferase [Bacillota bacterium]